MSLPARLLGANPSIQVSTLLSGSLSTPSAKQAFVPIDGYYSIASAAPTTGETQVVFSSIPQIYSHLEIHIHAMSSRGATGSTDIYAYFATYGSGTYAGKYLGANLSTGNAEVGTISYGDAAEIGSAYNNSNSNNRYSYGWVMIPNYSSTSMKKVIYSQHGVNSDSSTDIEFLRMTGSNWNQTSAISSITIGLSGGHAFKSGTRIDLYGIA